MFALVACCVAGCSELERLGVGPVVARPDSAKTSYGDELRVRIGAGTSDGRSLSVVETEGRLLVTNRTQALSFGVGPGYLHWFGPSALTVSLTPALGAEYFDRTLFASAGLHGGLGLGIVLAQNEHPQAPGMWWPALAGFNGGRRIGIVRRRTLLTLELTGAADARSRDTTLAAGLLIGIASSAERYYVEVPAVAPGWHL